MIVENGVLNDTTALMRLHVEALYTMRAGRLLMVNEPWGSTQPAPRLHIALPQHGSPMPFFRADVSETHVERVRQRCANEQSARTADELPLHIAEYVELLGAAGFTAERCYVAADVPADVTADCQLLSAANIDRFARDEFAWLSDEFPHALPCALIPGAGEGKGAAALCRSVRITARAHEAGIETRVQYRGRGYAGRVLRSWVCAVDALGALPLYSTAATNIASQRVALKCGLREYGTGVSIY